MAVGLPKIMRNLAIPTKRSEKTLRWVDDMPLDSYHSKLLSFERIDESQAVNHLLNTRNYLFISRSK